MKKEILLDERFSPLPMFVAMDPRATCEAKLIYAHLRGRAHNSKRPSTCFPSQELIAGYLCISVSTVKRATQELIEYGYIQKTQKKRQQGRHNEYFVFDPIDIFGDEACRKRLWEDFDEIANRRVAIFDSLKLLVESIFQSQVIHSTSTDTTSAHL